MDGDVIVHMRRHGGLMILACCCAAALASSAWGQVSNALLVEAKERFARNELPSGELLLAEYVKVNATAFPKGNTFGWEAASVALGALDAGQALMVIKELRESWAGAETIMIRQGIDAALLQACGKARMWDEGLAVVRQLALEPERHFLADVAMLEFSRLALGAGETNAALEVARLSVEGTIGLNNHVVSRAFWAPLLADTALLAENPDMAIRLLDQAGDASSGFCRTNGIAVVLKKVEAYKRMGSHSNVAVQLALAHDLLLQGYEALPMHSNRLESELKAYQHAGWLDDHFNANPRQVYDPDKFPALPGLSSGHWGLSRVIVIVLFAITSVVFLAFFLKRKPAAKHASHLP